MPRKIIFAIVLAIILSACAPAPQTSEVSETSEVLPSPTSTPAPSPTPEPPTSTPTTTAIPLPDYVLAALADQQCTLTDTDGDGHNDVMLANGDTLFRFVPPEERYDQGVEYQRYETLTLTDGSKLEMPRFETFENALKYISSHAIWRSGSRTTIPSNWFGGTARGPEVERIVNLTRAIPDFNPGGMIMTGPETGDKFVLVRIMDIGEDSLLVYEDPNNPYELLYVVGDVDDPDITQWGVFWRNVDTLLVPPSE